MKTIKMSSTKRHALAAAMREWSEGAVDVEENERKEGNPWEVRANGGVMAVPDALTFSIKINVAAKVALYLNERRAVVDWTKDSGTREEYLQAGLAIAKLLDQASEGRSWDDAAQDIMAILAK